MLKLARQRCEIGVDGCGQVFAGELRIATDCRYL